MNEYLANSFAESYDARYAEGYMSDWEPEKKQRVQQLVDKLELPAIGRALDFGCGTGVFTDVLHQVLPGWDIGGSDFSVKAIELARDQHPNLNFFTPDAPEMHATGIFDLVFTHHVLEHVTKLGPAIDKMVTMLKPRAHMVHVLPCGNPGSFEYSLAKMRRDGINTAAEGRFYYEDPGHVRRLTTDQLDERLGSYGFRRSLAYFTGHRWGAVDWISRSLPSVIDDITDPSAAVDSRSARKLRRLHMVLRAAGFVRNPAHVVGRGRAGRVIRLAVLPATRGLDVWLGHKAEAEWIRRKEDPTGSEMFLAYQRP